MGRAKKTLIVILFFIHISPIHAALNEGRNYSYLYLYYMDLSDEVKSSLDDFLQWYSKEANPHHYIELRITGVNSAYSSIIFRIDLKNSIDKRMMVINDEYFKSDWFIGSRFIGYSYYKHHWIILKTMNGVSYPPQKYIKQSLFPYVMRFILWRHDGFIPPVGTTSNDGLTYGVRNKEYFRYPQIVEE